MAEEKINVPDNNRNKLREFRLSPSPTENYLAVYQLNQTVAIYNESAAVANRASIDCIVDITEFLLYFQILLCGHHAVWNSRQRTRLFNKIIITQNSLLLFEESTFPDRVNNEILLLVFFYIMFSAIIITDSTV